MRETGTFDFTLDQSNAGIVQVYELFNAADLVNDFVGNVDSRVKYSVGVFIESLRATVYLPSFTAADFPATYPEDSAAERANKLLTVEKRFPKVGLGLYRKKVSDNNWKRLSLITLQNRGRESQLSILIPYLTVNQIKLLSRDDQLGVSCIDLGDGVIGNGEIVNNRSLDFVQLEGEYRIDIDADDALPRPIFLQRKIERDVNLSAIELLNDNSRRAYFEVQNVGDHPFKLSYGLGGLVDPLIIYPGQMYYPMIVKGLVMTDEIWVQGIEGNTKAVGYDYSLSY